MIDALELRLFLYGGLATGLACLALLVWLAVSSRGWSAPELAAAIDGLRLEGNGFRRRLREQELAINGVRRGLELAGARFEEVHERITAIDERVAGLEGGAPAPAAEVL